MLKGKNITIIFEDNLGNKNHLTYQLPTEKPAAGTGIAGNSFTGSSTKFNINIGISPSNLFYVSI